MAGTPFQVGSAPGDWPGLSKLNEEMGELIQVIGKLMATAGAVTHWEGAPLDERFVDELADVQAAIDFVLQTNDLPRSRFDDRRKKKVRQFTRWAEDQS